MSLPSSRSPSALLQRRITWRAMLAATALAIGAILSAAAPMARAGGPASQPVPVPSAEATTDRYIIKLRDPSADIGSRLPAISAAAGATFTYIRSMSGGAHVVRMGTKLPLSGAKAMSQQLMLDSNIAYMEPDRKMYPLLVPNDPLFGSQQWNLFESTGGINAPAAWDITTGSTSIVMAVIDTGYRPHVDLTGRFIGGYDFIGDLPTANDGNGRDTDATDPGDYNCEGSGNSSSWHGTHVSGILGAASNNGLGVTGVNWVSQILPVRVLGVCGGYTSDIVDGMRWAAGIAITGVPNNPNPARVLNLSLGGSGGCGSTFQSGIDDVVARGAVVVVAAGNSNSDVAGFEPAGCNNVIAVAATTRQGSKAYFSNYGAGVTVAAPGQGVISTLNSGSTTPVSDNYVTYNGTSMSSPHVAGVVGLMLSQNPALTPAQVKAKLKSSARAFPTGTGADCNTAICGAGILDAAAALSGGTTVPPVPAVPNLAAQSNGAVASSSSTHSAGYAPAGVNNGDRKGANWGSGGGWNDGTPNGFPDWVRVDFPVASSVSEIDVFSVQDNFLSPVEPTESMTFTKYGLVDFDVQYWNGAAWVTVPGGAINGNNKIWTKLTFAAVTTTAIRVNVRNALDTWSRVTEIEAYGGSVPVNVARPANGGSAIASSTHSSGYPPAGAIDGDRRGLSWGSGTGWNDGTADAFPDTLQVNFNGTKSINEIDVFSVQDSYMTPSEPTAAMTFSLYGLVDFDVQYWNGSAWVTVPGGTVNGNNLVWRKFTFAAVSTNAIRLNIRKALGTWSRVAEIEAYQAP